MIPAMTSFCPCRAYLGVSSSNFLRCQQDETGQAGREAGRQASLWDITRALSRLLTTQMLHLVCRAISDSHLQHRVYLRLPVDEGQPLELGEPGDSKAQLWLC